MNAAPAEPAPVCTYEPHGGARELFRRRDRHICFHGPAGTGKTRAVLEKVHLALCKYGGARALIVRDTRKSLTESVLVTYERKVCPVGWPGIDSPSRAFRSSYSFPNGSEIVVGGLDNPNRIMSTEYDMIAVFEATEVSEDAYEKLDTRLRNNLMPYQQIIADCNPSNPDHWLKKRMDSGASHGIASRHSDNPSLTTEYLESLAKLSGVRRARLFEGRWAAAEGLVYDNFDESVHVVDSMPEGWQAWEKIRSIDFGYTNPFVCQWWAIDPDGRMYLYREHYRVGLTVEEHAKHIIRLSGSETYAQTVADHDAEDRATLMRHGIQTTPANKAVSLGIQTVRDRLEKQGDGRPRLFVLRSALDHADAKLSESKRPCGLLQEMDSYVWKQPTDGRMPKEEPEKLHDHSQDCCRYAVMAIDREPAPAVMMEAEAKRANTLDAWMEDD